MVLTEAQKREILLKYIDPARDFVKASNGKILVSVEASQRIAQDFNLKIEPNAQFEPLEISNYIFQRELQRLAAAESIERAKAKSESAEKFKMNRVIECIKVMLEQGESDLRIAQILLIQCSDLTLSELARGIDKASQIGILPKDSILKNKLRELTNQSALTNKFIKFNQNVEEKEQLVTALATDMFNLYTKQVLNLGHLKSSLLDAGIQEDIIEAAMTMFYNLYQPVFVQQINEIELSNEELTKFIYDKYLKQDVFASQIILEYLMNLDNANINVEDMAYQFYRADGDERQVYKIMMIKGISTEERVQKLKDLDLQYPPSCLKRTFDILSGAYILPYDEIFEKYADVKISGNNEEEEELIPVSAEISMLSDSDDFEVLTSTSDIKDDEKSPVQSTILRVVKAEKETSVEEKKKTLAAFLVAAGFLPVVVLSCIFKTEPLVASKKCATALGQLTNSNVAIKELLPETSQLTALFAAMGTTFVGFVKYLKSKAQDPETLSKDAKKGRR